MKSFCKGWLNFYNEHKILAPLLMGFAIAIITNLFTSMYATPIALLFIIIYWVFVHEKLEEWVNSDS